MTQEDVVDLTQAVVHNLQDGDILFVDAETIDSVKLSEVLQKHFPGKGFLIVPVFVQDGKTVSDYLVVGRKEDLTQEIQQ